MLWFTIFKTIHIQTQAATKQFVPGSKDHYKYAHSLLRPSSQQALRSDLGQRQSHKANN